MFKSLTNISLLNIALTVIAKQKMERLGIIGWPVEHSRSPAMHNAAFEYFQMPWRYDKIPVKPDELEIQISRLQKEKYVGINVTLPHKNKILNWIPPDPAAKCIGAINTVDFRKNQGINTDYLGFQKDLHEHGFNLQKQKCLILGAGGAARAAIYACHQAKCQITIFNRNPEKADQVLAEMQVLGKVATEKDLENIQTDFIVNCTPVGMSPQHQDCPWPHNIPFPRKVVTYDMIYSPKETVLMKKIIQNEGTAIGGLGMLLWQGALAFQFWTNKEIPISIMRNALMSSKV